MTLVMKKQTISESLFEQFCTENSIPWNRVERDNDARTPDYDIYLNDNIIVVEVKQFDLNDKDKAIIKELSIKGRAAYWEEPGRRVRNKIGSAKDQLKRRSKNTHPTILILYDDVGGVVDRHDIMAAMYGQDTIKMEISKSDHILKETEEFGGKRKFTSTENTTFSAIALLYKNFDAQLKLSVFHNVHAKLPINIECFRYDTVKHFSIDLQSEGFSTGWSEL